MLYDYECIECKYLMEVEMKITENKTIKCPKCNENMKRIITNGNFILKGDCWAKDNYSRGNKETVKNKGD